MRHQSSCHGTKGTDTIGNVVLVRINKAHTNGTSNEVFHSNKTYSSILLKAAKRCSFILFGRIERLNVRTFANLGNTVSGFGRGSYFPFALDPKTYSRFWWCLCRKTSRDMLCLKQRVLHWYIEDKAFSTSYDSLLPHPLPPLLSASGLSFSVFLNPVCRRSSLLTG